MQAREAQCACLPKSTRWHGLACSRPHASSRYAAQLEAYQYLPDNELLQFHAVGVDSANWRIVEPATVRHSCDLAGEEIFNGREVTAGDRAMCQSCGSGGYYVVESRTFASLQPQSVESV